MNRNDGKKVGLVEDTSNSHVILNEVRANSATMNSAEYKFSSTKVNCTNVVKGSPCGRYFVIPTEGSANIICRSSRWVFVLNTNLLNPIKLLA